MNCTFAQPVFTDKATAFFAQELICGNFNADSDAMSLDYPTRPPPVALLTDNEDAADRIALVEQYNCLVGKPKKITRTIQKQFVMGFMSKDEIASLRSMYACVIKAVEATAGTGAGAVQGRAGCEVRPPPLP